MTTSNDINVVSKSELHYLPLCPCASCLSERERRDQIPNTHPNSPPTVAVPITAARILGLIPNPNPHGSLARQLSNDQLTKDDSKS